MNLKLSSIKNSLYTPLFAVLALLGMASETMAASVHLKADPVFTDLGTTLSAKISLAGLGNKDVVISVLVTGLASYTLINPGGNEVPGQNKLPISSSASVTVSKSAIKNGNVTVTITVPPVVAPPATELGAPNDLWVARIDNVEFLTAIITVQQGGKVVLQEEIDLD
jgi:hypothetical protein